MDVQVSSAIFRVDMMPVQQQMDKPWRSNDQLFESRELQHECLACAKVGCWCVVVDTMKRAQNYVYLTKYITLKWTTTTRIWTGTYFITLCTGAITSTSICWSSVLSGGIARVSMCYLNRANRHHTCFEDVYYAHTHLCLVGYVPSCTKRIKIRFLHTYAAYRITGMYTTPG